MLSTGGRNTPQNVGGPVDAEINAAQPHNAIQRGAQFMRHRAHQFALHVQRTLQVLGHAIECSGQAPYRVGVASRYARVQAALGAGAHAVGDGAGLVRLGPTVLRTSSAAAVALGALGVLTHRWDV